MKTRIAAMLTLIASSGLAQSSPFLPEDLYQKLVNEISGEIAHEHMRWFTHYHRPMGGSEGFEAVARYVETKAREYGLEDVRYIKLASESASWTAKHGELWLVDPERRRLAFTPEIAISMADYSRSGSGENVEIVDVGEGASESDYAGKPVAGKVVLAHGSLATVMDEAVWKRGALGIIYFTMNRRDFPDQIPWIRVPVENTDKTKQGTFAFVLSQREGLHLRRAIAAEEKRARTAAEKAVKEQKKRTRPVPPDIRPFKISYRIESSFLETPTQAMVEAMIRGSDIHDQDIVLTGHLQEELFSANDDASGCVNVLEIGRAVKSLIDRGMLPRPRRDIRFWWVDEVRAEEQYFADHPEERSQFLANINQDMVGAKQSLGSRVQFVTRPPASRSHFLGDVVESIVEALVAGNTAYLAAGQARQLARGETGTSAVVNEDVPFSRPILSNIGSREHYDARVIPFHNNTDHQVFNMGIIGIPAVTFTNWPDDYIHSTDDDLWQMDRTQLKRNAVAVAAIAWFLANAADPQVPLLGLEVYTRAMQRIQGDRARALRSVLADPANYGRAAGLVGESVQRESRAITSIRKIAGDASEKFLTSVEGGLPTGDDELRQFADNFRILTGREAPELSLSAREQELSKKIPTLTTSVKTYVEGRRKIDRPRTLHGLMAYEALNFVDGTRSYFDIYRAVAAEADSAGEWYYGRVTLEDIASYLDSAEKNGMITVKTMNDER